MNDVERGVRIFSKSSVEPHSFSGVLRYDAAVAAVTPSAMDIEAASGMGNRMIGKRRVNLLRRKGLLQEDAFMKLVMVRDVDAFIESGGYWSATNSAFIVRSR